MDNQLLSQDEAFHNCFFYFVKALGVMSLEPAAQYETMGKFNVAWEIQHDVLDAGISLQSWPGLYLGKAEKDEIARFVVSVKALPQAALMSTEDAVHHPNWTSLRVGAARLIQLLELPVKNNLEFFQIKSAK